MKKYQVKRIMHVRRLGTSLYGNPYYDVIFDDFTNARTQIDASINYEVENKDLRETNVAIFTTRAGRIWDIVPMDKLPDDTKYRWIVYLHQPMGGCEVQRVPSIEMAKSALRLWSRDVAIYEQATATLYPYSEENWAEAVEYAEIGCPFDYPSKVMRFGSRDGIKVEDA